MTVYLDTSVLAGLFIETDVFAHRAAAFFTESDEALLVSDYAAAEFASVVARVTRTNRIQETQARAIFVTFDFWRARFTEEEDLVTSDILAATTILRRLDLNIRAPDAINLAIAMRMDASIATFDRGLAENARALGLMLAVV